MLLLVLQIIIFTPQSTTMNEGLVVLISALPGVLIALGIWALDRRKEDPRNLVGLFFLGMAITIPAYAAQELSYMVGLGDTLSIARTLFFAFIIIAFTEEIFKFIVMRYYLMPKAYFDEKIDGIVFGVILAMGFATLENTLYAADLGLETVLVRIFTAVPAHGVFGAIMGYFISRAKFEEANKQQHLILAFVVPFLLHGLFDFFILQEVSEDLMGAALLVLLGGLIASIWMTVQFRKTTSVPKEAASVPSEEIAATTIAENTTITTTTEPPTPVEEDATIPENSTSITGSSVDPDLGYNESLEESIAEIEDELEDMREKLEDDEDD